MIDPSHFRREIIEPTLRRIGLYSPAATNLLLGTALQESGLRFMRQLGGGPAVGFYQMEPDTCRDIWANYLRYRQSLAARIREVTLSGATVPPTEELVWNLRYATAMARLQYLRVSEPLPVADDFDGLATYWKNHYNTALGRGRRSEFSQKLKDIMRGGPGHRRKAPVLKWRGE